MRSKFNFLIYPKFQLALILTNTLTVAINLFLVFFQNWKFNHHFVEMGERIGLVPGHAYFKFLEVQRNELILYSSIGFLITFLVSSLFFLVISHRLAGPIVRLRSYFKDISETGKVPEPFQIRQQDFFQDFIQTINQALKRLK